MGRLRREECWDTADTATPGLGVEKSCEKEASILGTGESVLGHFTDYFKKYWISKEQGGTAPLGSIWN